MPPRKPAPRPKPPARGAPAFTLTGPWAAAILGLLTVVFFNALVFGGQTFVAPDTTAPLGFVRVGERSLYHDHVYPLWNPYVFLGMPSFASLAYNPLIYPPDWPVAVLQRLLPLPDMTWMLIYYFLAGLFTYLLAREWGARPEAALIAGCAFAFTPNLVAVGAHGHGSQLVDSAYIPLVLWLAARFLRRGGIQHLGYLGLAGGCQILRAHFQIVYYTWLAVGLYVLIETLLALREPARVGRVVGRAAGVLLGFGLALALAGFLFLPLREYNHFSIRGGGAGGGVGMDYATSWSMAPREVFAFLVPNAVGFGRDTYWGAMPFTDYPHYMGVVTAVLALFAFLQNGPQRVFALVLGLLAVLVSFGKHFPLYQLLYDHLPYFKSFRVPVMIMVLFQLMASLGAAWGWTRLQDGAGERRVLEGRLLAGLAVLLALGAVLGLFGQDLMRASYVAAATKARAGYPREYAEYAFHAMSADLVRVAAIGLLTVGLAAWARRVKFSPALAGGGLLVLLLVDVWPVSGKVMEPTVGSKPVLEAEADRDDVVRFFEGLHDPGLFRVLNLTPGPRPIQVADVEGNRLAGFRIASLTGYHAAKPKLWQDAYDAGLFDNLGYLSVLNVKYLVAEQELPSQPFLRKVFDGSRKVYENLLAQPRAALIYRVRVVPDSRAQLDTLRSVGHDFFGEAVLDRDPAERLGPPAPGVVRVTRFALHRVELEVETPTPALVRLADLYYPAWKAEVDGRPAALLRADYLLRAVAVPAGRHVVRFRYTDASLRRGLLLSAASLLVSLGLVGFGALRRRAAA